MLTWLINALFIVQVYFTSVMKSVLKIRTVRSSVTKRFHRVLILVPVSAIVLRAATYAQLSFVFVGRLIKARIILNVRNGH